MNYQAIRAVFEQPLLTVFNAQVPPIPVYFDNITAVPPDAPSEYVTVNVTFGETNEPTLINSVDNARGALVIRVYCPKGKGPGRCQQLVTLAVNTLEIINATGKPSTGVYARTGTITGPTFSSTETSPHFMGRIETGWSATVLT